MTDRRRSLFVLLLVLGLLAGSLVVIAGKKTKLGLDLQGGVQLVYQARADGAAADGHAGGAAARAGHHARARRRVRRRGARVAARARNQIEVDLPGVENAERAASRWASTAQLFFYDWEANILDPNCKTDPDENVNGGSSRSRGLSTRRSSAAVQVRARSRTTTTRG